MIHVISRLTAALLQIIFGLGARLQGQTHAGHATQRKHIVDCTLIFKALVKVTIITFALISLAK